jgi:hypothetical protein
MESKGLTIHPFFLTPASHIFTFSQALLCPRVSEAFLFNARNWFLGLQDDRERPVVLRGSRESIEVHPESKKIHCVKAPSWTIIRCVGDLGNLLKLIVVCSLQSAFMVSCQAAHRQS